MHKTYRTSVKLSLPVDKGGEVLFCEFSDEKHSFNTMDEEVQSYIENTPMFKRGEISLFGSYEQVEELSSDLDEVLPDETPDSTDTDTIDSANDDGICLEAAEYPDVLNFQDASDILRKEPYRIHHSKTKKPEDILEQAKLLNVSFPNLVV
jgi:hypothetical protein